MTEPPLPFYGVQLNAGLGLIQETVRLLEIWQPGVGTKGLVAAALESGVFPTVSARRLRNIVVEAFGPRFLADDGRSAAFLQSVHGRVCSADFKGMLLIHTCRANPILHDFITDVYWQRYAAGHSSVGKDDAVAFVRRAVDTGRTRKRWSNITVIRMSRYLLGACEDFGLLGSIRGGGKIIPFRITPAVACFLAHDLHFRGLGDNAVVRHRDWALFGLALEDTLSEMKRLALNGEIILQTAVTVTHIAWKLKSMEELADVLATR
ncbi:MAG: BrxA family protein [Rhodospirillaceae bacterium]